MKVPNSKEVAIHIVPESCRAYREVRREALTGVRSRGRTTTCRYRKTSKTCTNGFKAAHTGHCPSEGYSYPRLTADNARWE